MCVLECVLTEDNQEEGHNWLCSQGEVNGLAVYHQSGVSRHLSGALGSLLVNTSSGRATQMDFQINYEARTCWNPPRIFTTLCVHHRRGASLLCTTRRMTTHLICAALILSALMARMCVCASAHVSLQTNACTKCNSAHFGAAAAAAAAADRFLAGFQHASLLC